MVTEDLCFNSKFRGSCREGLLDDGPNNNKKKCTSLEDNFLEILLQISCHKNPLSINDVKWVLKNWKGQRERRIFSSDL